MTNCQFYSQGERETGVTSILECSEKKQKKTFLYAETQSGYENSSQQFDLLGRDLITHHSAAQGVDWMRR